MTVVMTFKLGPSSASRHEVRFVLPAMVLVASAALYLLAREARAQEADGSASLVLDYGRLAAETGIWLSTAWLGRRLLSAAILTYAARTAQSGRASLLIDGGSQLLIDIGGAIIFAAALLVIVAGVYHLPLGGLLATSGVVAAIIGFAIQRMIADVFSGLALNIEHPFAVGDWIETSSGVTGRVLDANWRAVHLVTIEGRAVIIPTACSPTTSSST